jgi:uncharacterized flavoprotein (TIGR03862 family)
MTNLQAVQKRRVAIIGAGASALMLACELDPAKFEVDIYERNPKPGRKFLVAGDGGLNLTHSEERSSFIGKYSPCDFLRTAFLYFDNKSLATWFNENGIPTYMGTSGRVFPKKGIKPIEVLETFLKKIETNEFRIHTRHEWLGFDKNNSHRFLTPHGIKNIETGITVFCLGGASWPVTGSKGDWQEEFRRQKIGINNFEASNCSFKVQWPEEITPKIEGKALKNLEVTDGEKKIPGEVVLTRTGIEGSGIYPFGPEIRSQLHTKGHAQIFFDMKPLIALNTCILRLQEIRKKNNYSRGVRSALNLSDAHMTLIRGILTKEEFLSPQKLAGKIKKFTIKITGTGPIEDAISTVGGVDLSEIDSHFQLKKIPGTYVIGEMLDFDAPTGGYLLQSCFSMGKYLAGVFNGQVS